MIVKIYGNGWIYVVFGKFLWCYGFFIFFVLVGFVSVDLWWYGYFFDIFGGGRNSGGRLCGWCGRISGSGSGIGCGVCCGGFCNK